MNAHSQCRKRLAQVMLRVREIYNPEQIKKAWAWGSIADGFDFHSFDGNEYYDDLDADCLWSASAAGWERYLEATGDDTNNGTLALMRHYGAKMAKITREEYLCFEYMGNPPDEIGPELEAELPARFRKVETTWEEKLDRDAEAEELDAHGVGVALNLPRYGNPRKYLKNKSGGKIR